jgi:16S rRNA (cytidine1402-2'-O)-methyltransferase
MGRQKSQQTSRKATGLVNGRRRSGTLFIVGTPIGSPDDLTLRARAVLGRVSLVVAETPLATRALLDHHGIAAPITGYRTDEQKIAVLLDRLNNGHDIALVCDSGMPVIYDPGRVLITAARSAGHQVSVVPGPSALTAAAAVSGFHADRLLFVGKVPRSRRQLDRFFTALVHEVATVVLFAQSSALPRILERIGSILPNRSLTLAVNMTKADEEVHHGRADVLLQRARTLAEPSDVTLVLSGAGNRRK